MDAYRWMDEWLQETIVGATGGPYRHTLHSSKAPAGADVITELRKYVDSAHDDARRHFAAAFSPSLDPGGGLGTPAELYPWSLPTTAKQGYFGECLAALMIQRNGAFGESEFRIPALLFRFHSAAFDWIMKDQQGAARGEMVGRFGNDIVAFKIDQTPKVVESLVVEAKCLTEHRADTLREAHEQVSDSMRIPFSTYQVVQILRDRPGVQDKELIPILQTFMNSGGAGASRSDLIAYTCTSAPVNRDTWAPLSSPSPSYTGGRRLQVVENHIQDLRDLVDRVYQSP